MEPYFCNLDPDFENTLKVYLYKNVLNIEVIRKNIVNSLWPCAMVKPSLVVSPLQLAAAANMAVIAERTGSLVTKTVFTEILYNLSLSKNISQSLSKFGIETEQNILVCFLETQDVDKSTEILSQIEGVAVPINDLGLFTDVKSVKATYKLNNVKCDYELLDIIISRMTTKKFVTYYNLFDFTLAFTNPNDIILSDKFF